VKIATLNINNVNRRLPNLLAWLKSAKPDVVCLQELKCEQDSFPAEALAKAGYQAAWKGQRTWNGVAILSRGLEPIVRRTELPGDKNDTQSRYIEAAINELVIGCIYLPNGNPQPGPKFDYKLDWFKRLQRPREQVTEVQGSRGSGRRLQRRPHRNRHLSDHFLG
jgi:exodeoxyribonuclease-3